MKANLQNQGSFDFEAAPPLEPKPKLDADGHFFWARFCRTSQEHCIAQSCKGKDEVEVMAWAALAKHWKALATHHEAKGHLMEGLREGQ